MVDISNFYVRSHPFLLAELVPVYWQISNRATQRNYLILLLLYLDILHTAHSRWHYPIYLTLSIRQSSNNLIFIYGKFIIIL